MSQTSRNNFIEAQQLVFSKGLDLEKDHGRHRHFPSDEDVPLQKLAELGRGGFGCVDKVISTISCNVYARKLIPRGLNFRKDREMLQQFEVELSHLKKMSHGHIVKLVGSYTDPKYVVKYETTAPPANAI
jgi:serine/threonine protein kinase